MNLTVTEFGVVEQVLLCALTSGLGDSGDGFALLLRILNLLEHHLGDVGIAVEVVVELGLDEVVDELIDGDISVGRHVFRAEFDFRLGLEDGFFDVNGYRSNNTVTDVSEFLVLIEKLLDGSSDGLAVSGLVRTTLNGVLSVDEGIILVSGLIGMGQGNFDIFAGDVNNRIEGVGGHALSEQVKQAVFGDELFAVIDEGEAGVEVCVVTQHGLDILIAESIVGKEFFVIIGGEGDKRTAFGSGLLAGTLHPFGNGDDSGIFDKDTLFEGSTACAVITESLHHEIGREGVDSLRTDTVQTDGLMESLIVVLTTGVDNRDSVDEFAQRNTTTVVAYGNLFAFNGHLDNLTFLHAELVNGVIDCLFD